MSMLLAAAAEAANAAQSAAPIVPAFAQKSLVFAAGFLSIGLAAIGSAYGTGVASCAAIGSWKKCYAQNKPAPFQLLIFAGAPLSQTIYGMIIMFIVLGGGKNAQLLADYPGIWSVYTVVGVFSGIAMGISAIWQGLTGAAAADAFAESGKGFTNQLMALGIVETVAIFVMAFAIVLLGSF